MSGDLTNIGFVLDPADNVATLPWGGRAGNAVRLRGTALSGVQALTISSDIAPGHKVSLTDISKGAAVLKYGLPIGIARLDIPAGALVHVDNVSSRFSLPEKANGKVADTMAVILSGALVKAVSAVLEAAGAAPEAAEDTARHLASAEERGVSTHGIRRLPALVTRLRAGGINGSASPLLQRHGALVSVDGLAGLGHHVARLATDSVIKTARETGVAVALVRNSSHFGYAGFYATLMARAGMVGIAVSNGQVLVGPPGACQAIFSNNPLALAAPIGSDGLFEFDMATSVTSRAHIAMAAETGAAIAPGIALDGHGRPTVDAADALAGILLPLGGEKGFGLIAALEVLTGVLPGGAYADQVVSKEAEPDHPEGTSHFLMAISPAVCGSEETFRERMSDLEQRVVNLPMAPGTAPARLPGSRRVALAKEAARAGLPLSKAALEVLKKLTSEAGVQLDLVMEVTA